MQYAKSKSKIVAKLEGTWTGEEEEGMLESYYSDGGSRGQEEGRKEEEKESRTNRRARCATTTRTPALCGCGSCRSKQSSIYTKSTR